MNERNKRTVKFHFAKKWKDKIFLIFYTYNFAHLHRRLISIETKMEFYFSEDIQKYHTKRKMYYPVANNHFVHLKKKCTTGTMVHICLSQLLIEQEINFSKFKEIFFYRLYS